MKILITDYEFNFKKSRDKIPLECIKCNGNFFIEKHFIDAVRKGSKEHTYEFCSKTCSDLSKRKRVEVKCKECSISFIKKVYDIKKTKNNFCSRSCAAKYNNTHKIMGFRRSKLELWLEQQLKESYPKIDLHFNRKDAINSELDIYIPSLNLAFELNGVFHYKPIYGKNKLNKIKNNDLKKKRLCKNKNIKLHIINTSKQKTFKINHSFVFLKKIKQKINENFIVNDFSITG